MNTGKLESQSARITTNTTVTPWSGSVSLVSLVVNVTGAPTAWVITVQTKESTPKILFSKSYGAASVSPDSVLPGDQTSGIEMIGGIDIITTGTTPSVANVWLTAERLYHD